MIEINTPTRRRVAKTIGGLSIDTDLRHRYMVLNQPMRKIAADYSVAPPTVARWLRTAGVPIRPRGPRPRRS
jgi:hypothetical protein